MTRDKILNDLNTLPADLPDRVTARNAWQLFERSYQNGTRAHIHAVYPNGEAGEWTHRGPIAPQSSTRR